MGIVDVGLAVLVTAIWGLGFTLAKATLASLPPLLLMALRYTVCAAALIWFVPPPRGNFLRLAAAALVGVVLADAATFTGMAGLEVSTAILLVQLSAPFAALMGAVIFKERLRGRDLAGIALAFAGVALIVGEPSAAPSLLPVALVVAGAAAWAAGQLIVKTMTGTSGLTTTAWLAALSAPMLWFAALASAPAHDATWQGLGWREVATVLYLGLAMTAGGYVLWFRLLARHPVRQVMPFVLLVPLFSVLGGVLFLDEVMTPLVAGGGATVILGLWLLLRRPAAEARPQLGT